MSWKKLYWTATCHSCHTFPTWARGDDTPSCIDWVIANTDNIVNDISIQSPLGNSDHVLIECSLNIQPRDEENYRTKLYYDKGDYTRTKIQDLPTSTDVDTMWDFLTNVLHEAKDTYIPKKKVKMTGNKKMHHSPYDEKIIRKIKKHGAWQRYLETKSGQKLTEHWRLSKQVKNLTTKAKKEREKKHCQGVQGQPLRKFGITSARNIKSSREFLILCTKMKTVTKKHNNWQGEGRGTV